MRIKYNAPVILSFALCGTAVMVLSTVVGPDIILNFFSVPGNGQGFRFLSTDALRLVFHALGHSSWAHLLGNFTFILLIGPILEEKYGSGPLLFMMFLEL